AQVAAPLVERLAEAAQGVEDEAVELARVRLPGDGDERREAHLLGDAAVELLDLVVVAAEQRQEARLRAGRPLRAAERQPVAAALQFFEVEDEVVQPQRRALADGRELRRLE